VSWTGIEGKLACGSIQCGNTADALGPAFRRLVSTGGRCATSNFVANDNFRLDKLEGRTPCNLTGGLHKKVKFHVKPRAYNCSQKMHSSQSMQGWMQTGETWGREMAALKFVAACFICKSTGANQAQGLPHASFSICKTQQVQALVHHWKKLGRHQNSPKFTLAKSLHGKAADMQRPYLRNTATTTIHTPHAVTSH
jgi:hypothetical protein